MSNNLPTSTETNQTGRLGVTFLQVTFLQECVEKEGWIFRRQDGDSDFGIDGEIEIFHNNKVTGRLTKCQVKSSDSVMWRDEEASVSVKVTTYNLWRDIPILTILFLVDTKNNGIYWTPALAHHPKAGTTSLSIKFEKTSDLCSGIGPLRDYLNSWFAISARDTILREVPHFHRIFQELWSDVDHYDDWSEMGDEEDGWFRLLYRHVLRLRLDLGLRNNEIPSLDDWYVRNMALWNGGAVLYWGTFSEAIKVIAPPYQEAISRLSVRLDKAEFTFENQDIKNFLANLEKKQGHYIICDDRISDSGFHNQMENMLRKIGALKYSIFNKRK